MRDTTLETLSTYGRTPGATFADGVSRVAYSASDIEARTYVINLIRSAGVVPRVDAAGNIFGLRNGSDPSLKPILFGSHIDSVPSGGNFDGNLGVLAAIEILHTLQDHKIITRHLLQCVIWQNEEGGLVGSRAVLGDLLPSELDESFNGLRLAEAIRRIGGDPTQISDARITPSSIRCYLELHVEQGASLFRAGTPIGVVDGIVAIDDYEVEIRGFANHAGTTPMAERHNALLAAAKLIESVEQIITREPGRQVGTVGHLEVLPNASNVIPGFVRHSIELRDLSSDKIARLGKEIRRRADEIARDTGTEILIKNAGNAESASAAPEIQLHIEQAASSLGLKTMHPTERSWARRAKLGEARTDGNDFCP